MDQNVNKDCTETEQISPETTTIEHDKPFIFMLNYDCFEEIFSYLDLGDLCQAAKTCKYFRNVAHEQLKSCTTLNIWVMFIHHSFQLIDVHSILKLCGHLLTTLVWNMSLPIKLSIQLIALLARYCTRLKHVSFEYVATLKNHEETLKPIIGILKYVESLALMGCNLTEDDGEIINFGVLNLKELNLANNSELTGKCLRKLVSLESLNLNLCCNIRAKYFTQILQNNKSLKYLNIASCYALSADNFHDIVRHSNELNHLVISNYYPSVESVQLKIVLEIPKLTKLEVIGRANVCLDALFIDLAYSNKLELLIIDGNILTKNALNHLKYFTCLKTIKLRWNPNLVDSVLDSLTAKMTLEHVWFTGSDNITSQGLQNFLEMCPNIKYLDVMDKLNPLF